MPMMSKANSETYECYSISQCLYNNNSLDEGEWCFEKWHGKHKEKHYPTHDE